MAVKQVRFDDMNGEAGAQPVVFSIDGVRYNIDLTESNIQALHAALNPFIEHARKQNAHKQTKSTAVRTPARSGKVKTEHAMQLEAIRSWARSTGRKVSDRGRINKEVMDAFMAAHNSSQNSSQPAIVSAVG